MSTVKIAAHTPATSERAEGERTPNRMMERKPMKVLARKKRRIAVFWEPPVGRKSKHKGKQERHKVRNRDSQ